jgi:hypothetical protein
VRRLQRRRRTPGTAPLPFAFGPYSNALDLGSAKQMKQNINTLWIYPSFDDPEEILAQAASRLLNSEHAAAVTAARG